MRNLWGCKPCVCGGHQHHNHQQQDDTNCNDNVRTVVEPTVHCNIEDRHHHKTVRHIVPVVYHQRHHHHTHHEYVVKRKYTEDHKNHEHGKFDGDWCNVDSKNNSCNNPCD